MLKLLQICLGAEALLVIILSQQLQTATEIRPRWQRVFLGAYLLFTAGAISLTTISIVTVLLDKYPQEGQGPRISTRADKLPELRGCHKDVQRLLRDLHKEAFTVQARALRYDIDPMTDWGNWSTGWMKRWHAVDWRCRLSDLQDTDVSPVIHRLAGVHQALQELQISYGGVVQQFSTKYIERLRNFKRDLSDIRVMIEKRKQGLRPKQSNTIGVKR